MRNRLHRLLAENRRPFVPMAKRVVAAAAGEATVYLYDPIVADRLTAEWWGGVCPQDFVPALRGISAGTIHLRVNSPGGDVFGAEAMCQAIREHPAHIVAHIEGLAASAATAITCACDEVVISPASKFMIHETWTLAMGNKRELAAVIALLDKCDTSMYAEYARKTGNDLAQLQAWCEAETWFTAQEAIDAGFADALAETKAAAKACSAWRLSAYLHAPAAADVEQPLPGAVPGQPEPEIVPPADTAAEDRHIRQQQRFQLLSATRIE